MNLKHGDMVRIGLVKWTFSFELPKARPIRSPPKVTPVDPVEVEEAPKEKRRVKYVDEAKPDQAPFTPTPAPVPCGYGAPPVPYGGAPCVNGLNGFLPVPFPVMQPIPLYPQPPAVPPTEKTREREAAREREDGQESEWKHDLLQKLWQLEANIARLADANQEICQAIRRSESKLDAPDVRPDLPADLPADVRESPDYEEELSKAVTALTCAAERLSMNAELILDKEDQVWKLGI